MGVQRALLAVSATQAAFYVLAWLSPDGTAGNWEAPAKRSLALSLLLLDDRYWSVVSTRCRSSPYCSSRLQVLQQQLLLRLLLLLRASQQQKEVEWWSTSRDGSHRSVPLVWQNCVGS